MKTLKNINIMRTCTIVIFTIIVLPSMAWPTTYYVDATNGNDASDGLSTLTAWQTIGKVNMYAKNPGFDDGDTIKFKRGTVFNNATLRSPKANNITFEDYGTGAKPLFDGDVIRPIYIDDSAISNLTIRNIDISGMDWKNWIGANIVIWNVDGVTIDGIEGNGHRGGQSPNQVGGVGMLIRNTTGDITIKNSTIYNWGTDPILEGTEDSGGIKFFGILSGNIYIYNNVIYNITSDCVALHNSPADNIYIYSNTFYNFGEQAIDLKGTHNVKIYENEFYGEEGFALGTGGTGGGNPTAIIAGTRADRSVLNENFEIYDNYFHDLVNTAGVIIYYMNGIKVYRNYFEKTAGIVSSSGSDNIEIFYNVMVDPMDYIVGEKHVGGIYDTPGGTPNSKIYNNTIYNNSGSSLRLIVSSNSRSEIKNNIVVQNKNDANAYAYYKYTNANDPTVEYNIWHNPLHSNRTYWEGTAYSSSQLKDWINSGHQDALFSDPLFANPGNRNFSLSFNSLGIDGGVDAGLFKDFEGTPVPQGSGVDMGAFEYINITPPKNLRVIIIP